MLRAKMSRPLPPLSWRYVSLHVCLCVATRAHIDGHADSRFQDGTSKREGHLHVGYGPPFRKPLAPVCSPPPVAMFPRLLEWIFPKLLVGVKLVLSGRRRHANGDRDAVAAKRGARESIDAVFQRPAESPGGDSGGLRQSCRRRLFRLSSLPAGAAGCTERFEWRAAGFPVGNPSARCAAA